MPRGDGAGTTSVAARPRGWLSGLAMLGGLLLVRSALRWLRHDGHAARSPRVSQEAVQAGHQTGDAPVTPVLVGGLAVLVGLGIALTAATWFQAAWVTHPLTLRPLPGLATPAAPPPPPEPRLEEVPGDQLRQYQAAQQRILTDTSWMDRQAGIARIPIDRAIDLLTEHPLPSRPVEDAAQFAAGSAGPPSRSSSGRAPTGRAP